MSRCDYEGVFYRVFCVSLLIIAFSFTVILTNVFIDIDGLLSRKEQASAESQAPFAAKTSYKGHGDQTNTESTTPETQEHFNDGDRNYDDEGAYRTKRSLDSADFLLHIKNPKVKNVLTNRLATLLEELDEEESRGGSEIHGKTIPDVNDIYVHTNIHKDKESRQEAHEVKQEISDIGEKKDENNLLHLSMHNLLLQGIIGHMDLNAVYKKVHALVRRFKNTERNEKENDEYFGHPNVERFDELTTAKSTTPVDEENKFFDELITCQKLQQEIAEATKEKKKENSEPNVKSPNFFIKTLIDIQKNDKELDPNAKENFKGIIKLIYNGKSIKINSMDEYESTTVKKTNKVETTTANTANKDVEEIVHLLKDKHLPKSYVTTILFDYLKKYQSNNLIPEHPIKLKEKRFKRNIKLNLDNQTEQQKIKSEKKEDDELFVEIETHFDSKGLKGKKKEELVKQLIERIQKAIRSNQEEKKQTKHRHEIHVKKRVQDPLGHRNESHHTLLLKKVLPYDLSLYRELYPISKIGSSRNPLASLTIGNGEDWKQKESGPKFISSSKSINSAELGIIDVDFNKVMELAGIPQRLQMPLNSDSSSENVNPYFDVGSLQFLIKELEGTGFSIGFNQYVDRAPDAESMKSYTGIEKLTNKYHQNYDYGILSGNTNSDTALLKHDMNKRDINSRYGDILIKRKNMQDKHSISRRSADKSNFNSKEYNIIYYDGSLPYNNYQGIYKDKQKQTSLSMAKNLYTYEKTNEIPVNKLPKNLNQILEKKLKPSEIFSLANLLDRTKRSLTVQKIKKINTKRRINRFINTNAMSKQRIFLKSKRNKRQIDKIRIIAKEKKAHSNSDENIFIDSDENVYANRAIIRHLNVPSDLTNENKAEEQVDAPFLFENYKPPLFDALEDTIRRNPLMLKYPHVFLDDIHDARFTAGVPTKFGRILTKPIDPEMTTENYEMNQMPKVQDLVNALKSKSNYKVTVKLLPKDGNDTNAGFREIHTSINKTFNKDGLMYSSIVNVSEVSKIESSNHSVSQAKNNYNNDLNMKFATTPNAIENNHEELKNIIREHKKRIDRQLNHLHEEKEKLNTIIRNKGNEDITEINKELVDIPIPSNPPKVIHLSKVDIGKLLCDTIKQEPNEIPTKAPTTIPTTTIKAEYSATTLKSLVMDPLKVKLLKAISQNELLTSQILNKIDENSILLQSFLSKITDKLQTLPDITRQAIIEHEKQEKAQENLALTYNNSQPVYMRLLNNQTDIGKPFIYAYQKPNKLQDKVETPIASIVYHDYINPNTAEKNGKITGETNSGDFRNDLRKHMLQRNETRYFIDEDFFKTFVLPGEKDQITRRDGVKILSGKNINQLKEINDASNVDNDSLKRPVKRNTHTNIFRFNGNASNMNTSRTT